MAFRCARSLSASSAAVPASSHFVRERGVERRLLLGSLVRGRLSIGGGLLLGELSRRFLIGQAAVQGLLCCALDVRSRLRSATTVSASSR